MNRQKTNSIKRLTTSVAVAAALFLMTLSPCTSAFASSDATNHNRDKQMEQASGHIKKHKTASHTKKSKHKTYVPSEKITADEAVAFPADI